MAGNGNISFDMHTNLEEIIAKEFVKKMENLYMKQFMLRDFDENTQKIGENRNNETFSEAEFND